MKETQDVIHRDTDIVSQVVAQLEHRLGADRFETWFGAETRIEFLGGEICVVADSEFRMERLRKGFLREIEAAVRAAVGPSASVAFRIAPIGKISSASADDAADDVTADELVVAAAINCDGGGTATACATRVSPPQSISLSGVTKQEARADVVPRAAKRSGGAPVNMFARPEASSHGRKFANLSDLQRGPCNQVALSAADMLIRSPGTINPLFVHGPSGTGKTHLLEGIWCEARRRGGRRVIYLSAEQFTTYFLQALRGSGLPNFRQKYRGVDLLIIDDVQFFEGKQATITELLHTVETLQREGRQVVLAADRAAAELGSLGPELMARIQSGLVCAIEPLDISTRSAVVQQLIEQRQLTLPVGAVDLIAQRAPGDARQLTGLVNRLWATREAQAGEIELKMVVSVVDELYPPSSTVVKLDDIERVVCSEFGIDAATLKSDQRSRRVSYPRMLAMWLARKHTQAALTEIGDFFGRKSHSTVVSAQNKVDAWVSEGGQMDAPQQLPRDVRLVVKRLEQRLRA